MDTSTELPPISFMAQLAEGHHAQAFDIAVVQSRLAHTRRRHLMMRSWDITELSDLGLVVTGTSDTSGGRLTSATTIAGDVVEIVQSMMGGSIRVASASADGADELVAKLSAGLAELDRPEDLRVPVWFWTMSAHGPHPMRRLLHAPEWSEIAENYEPAVREALESIMYDPPKVASGIALWRGKPGTGKTTALRALAREWKDNCEMHVVLDPEVFLGEQASYLVELMFGDNGFDEWEGDDDSDFAEGVSGEPVDVSFGGNHEMMMAEQMGPQMFTQGIEMPHFEMPMGMHPMQRGRPKSRLVVLEDAGELISADARVSAGQALSRLLNLTDGMLGQGSNVSVLVTTNEPIERLHPAVSRQGRGWAHIAFRTIGEKQANAWLEEHGVDDRIEGNTTLADLYAMVQGGSVILDDFTD